MFPFAAGYTRRRLGGRQPLCGIGVTSRMKVILKPEAWSARSELVIEKDQNVVVTAMDGLTLEVLPAPAVDNAQAQLQT